MPFAVTITVPFSVAVVLLGVTVIELVAVVKLDAVQPDGNDHVYVAPGVAAQVKVWEVNAPLTTHAGPLMVGVTGLTLKV